VETTGTSQHQAPPPGVEHAHPGPRVYVAIALWLAAATAAEVGLYYLKMPHGLFIGLLMFFMIIKFSLVVAYFMHLKFDAKIFRRLMVTGLALAITVYMIVLLTFGLFRAH
jgi:cytochrome c oxidase subunit IV